MHPLVFCLLLLPLAAQADVFKCIDKTGNVTYTNSACAKAGLKEDKVIPPPPPPAVDSRSRSMPEAKPAAAKTEPAPAIKQTALMQVTKATPDDPCGRLNEDMGRTLDEMDAARDRGATPQQQAAWNGRLERIQTEKTRLSCF